MALVYEYLMKRGDFGKQPLFCEQGPEMADNIVPDKAEQKRYMLRNPVHTISQNTSVLSEHYINTIRAEVTASGINHDEGGWPKDVNQLDPEATARYRRKIEKDDPYVNCVLTNVPITEHYINQNNAIDMYRIYNKELPTMPDMEKISCRKVNTYRDDPSNRGKRYISSISWQADGGKRFAATYVNVNFNREPRSPIDAAIWNVERPQKPELVLEPIYTMVDLKFSTRNKNDLIGGLINGQVGCWDRRVGGTAIAYCEAHVAHRDMVTSVLYINSKAGTEFFSAGADGVCKWWDVRNLSEYTDQVIIDLAKISTDMPDMAKANGVSVLEYETTIPTRFMVGTVNGMIVSGNRKGKTQLEILPAKFDAHNGPVRSLMRNPGFLKNFLSVGDWTAKIWSDDCRESPILWTAPHRHKICDGIWSNQRLSLMLLAQSNGKLSIWDILRSQHEPVLTLKVCRGAMTKLVMHENSTLVACGTERGDIYMMELSQSLAQSHKNDKGLMISMFDREVKREKILEARSREIRLKLKQAEEGTPQGSLTEIDPTIGDKDLAEATAEFHSVVKKEQAGF